MKVAFGGVFHETNTFSIMRTTIREFESGALVKGKDIIKLYDCTKGTIGGIIDASKEYDIALVPTLYAMATPGGIVEDKFFESIVDELCERIPKNVDGIILALHGAMVTETKQDAEGYLISKVREKVGERIPIVCTLDLHANISPQMVDLSECLVGFDTYPHNDYYDRAYDAVKILKSILDNDIKPVSVLSKPPIMPVVQRLLTEKYPMKCIIDMAKEIEKHQGVINVTIAGGFPYADVEWAGMSVIVTTNNDKELAQALCNEIENKIMSLRNDFVFENISVTAGVAKALKTCDFPFVLVDSSDNVGGGSSGDGTQLLEEIIKQGLRSCLIFIKDTEVVSLAEAVGVGNIIKAYVGGKTDDMHGSPVYIEAEVKKLSDGQYYSERTGELMNMGKTAVLECNGVLLILTEERLPAFDLEAIRSLGVQPSELKYIVVKGAVQWKESYGTIAKGWIDVDAAGVTSSNFKRFKFTNIRRPIFPLDNI